MHFLTTQELTEQTQGKNKRSDSVEGYVIQIPQSESLRKLAKSCSAWKI